MLRVPHGFGGRWCCRGPFLAVSVVVLVRDADVVSAAVRVTVSPIVGLAGRQFPCSAGFVGLVSVLFVVFETAGRLVAASGTVGTVPSCLFKVRLFLPLRRLSTVGFLLGRLAHS